jgi:hypothetical protein
VLNYVWSLNLLYYLWILSYYTLYPDRVLITDVSLTTVSFLSSSSWFKRALRPTGCSRIYIKLKGCSNDTKVCVYKSDSVSQSKITCVIIRYWIVCKIIISVFELLFVIAFMYDIYKCISAMHVASCMYCNWHVFSLVFVCMQTENIRNWKWSIYSIYVTFYITQFYFLHQHDKEGYISKDEYWNTCISP